MRACPLVLALTLAALVVGAASLTPSGCCCPSVDSNCPDLVLEAAPVCDERGVPYISRCVAECQGVTDLTDGDCAAGEATYRMYFKSGRLGQGDSSTLSTQAQGTLSSRPASVDYFDFSKVDSSASIDESTILRFSPSGYKFSAKLHLKSDMAQDMEEKVPTTGIPPPPTNGTVLAALLTKGGYLYMKAIDSPDVGVTEGEPSAALPGQPGNLALRAANEAAYAGRRRRRHSSRKLLLVGPDDRVEINTKEYPYSAVGFLSVGSRGCTATLIGRRFLITAGHCVYDTATRNLYDISTMWFYPNQHGGPGVASGRRVSVDHIMTPYNNANPPVPCGRGLLCQQQADREFDLAIIILDENIGDEYGYLSLGYTCENQTYSVSTAGYPGDLPGVPYTMYGTTGTLQNFEGCNSELEANVITSDLDTAPGQSGSSIWDMDFVIRAVHVAGGGPYHRSVSRWVYNQVKAEIDSHSGPQNSTATA